MNTAIQKEYVRGQKPMAKKWEQNVAKSIERKGTKGVFKAAAERAGKSTEAFAEEHKNDKGKLGKRARLAIIFLNSKKK